METIERFRGSLLGLATGDAVGTTVEFLTRGSVPPVTDMVGGGPFSLKAGEWTDDTSMALCVATSLLDCNDFDARDQMERYCRWYRHGYLSSNGECFDIGTTVRRALSRYEATGDPYSGTSDPMSAGNGSIMRLAPVPMFYYPHRPRMRHYSVESSRTTHGALECLEACSLLADILGRALAGEAKDHVLLGTDIDSLTMPSIQNLARGDYRGKDVGEIAGTGYVVQSLEAALWCFGMTDSFSAAILTAVNLGDDADTTAAICGQVAGAYYGEQRIPASWLARLAMRDGISELADKLYERSQAAQQLLDTSGGEPHSLILGALDQTEGDGLHG